MASRRAKVTTKPETKREQRHISIRIGKSDWDLAIRLNGQPPGEVTRIIKAALRQWFQSPDLNSPATATDVQRLAFQSAQQAQAVKTQIEALAAQLEALRAELQQRGI